MGGNVGENCYSAIATSVGTAQNPPDEQQNQSGWQQN